MRPLLSLLFVLLFSLPATAQQARIWTTKKAWKWQAENGWRVGANFNPSTAINQMEMWQAETFDPATIRRELTWASDLGMNAMRVYLHNLAWESDPEGLKQRMREYLTIADELGIKTIFVLFDDCWNNNPKTGPQPDPVPGVHNSGWVQAPGVGRVTDSTTWAPLKAYTQDILRSFGKDRRIMMWDLYNEPGNSGYLVSSMPLLKAVFRWAWEVRPSQPLTCATWNAAYTELNAFQLASSDVITFHNYSDSANLHREILELQRHGRPILCSEYMARTNNSRFETCLPVLKQYGVGAINWGLVSGRSNTIFPWGSKEGSPEPKVWFHDIFRADGTPFSPEEVAFIREMLK